MRIISRATGRNLTLARKSLLASAAVAAIAGPFATGLLAQQAQAASAAPVPTLSFEAASVKPVETCVGAVSFTVLPNRLEVQRLNLPSLILRAYDLAAYQLSAPDELVGHCFDITASSGKAVSPADMRVMLQSLLIERFHLATHWETRTAPMYRLVVLPGGPKMKVADHGYEAGNSPMRDGNSIKLSGPMSMRQLSVRMTPFAGKPVVDATNLEGYFTIALSFAAGDLNPSEDTGLALPLLPKAVEEQLGLKLVPGKDPIKILVVDHADTVPVPN